MWIQKQKFYALNVLCTVITLITAKTLIRGVDTRTKHLETSNSDNLNRKLHLVNAKINQTEFLRKK